MLIHSYMTERYIYPNNLLLCMGNDNDKYLTHTIYVYSDGTIKVRNEEKPIREIELEYEQ